MEVGQLKAILCFGRGHYVGNKKNKKTKKKKNSYIVRINAVMVSALELHKFCSAIIL